MAGLVDLADVGRHLNVSPTVDERHVGLATGGHLQADGAAGGVEGDVAAADHDDLLADRRGRSRLISRSSSTARCTPSSSAPGISTAALCCRPVAR